MSALTQAAPDLIPAFTDTQLETVYMELDNEMADTWDEIADLRNRLAAAEREAQRLAELDKVVGREGMTRKLW